MHSGAAMKRSVVTGGDAAFFPLLRELLASVREVRSAEEVELVVLDCGLLPEQADDLKMHFGVRVVVPGWEYRLNKARIRGREHLKVQIARAFLDTHCPDSDLIAWLDADTWVQDISALDMLFEAAAEGKLAIVSEGSRYAEQAIWVRWRFFGTAEVRSILYKNARRARIAERDARAIGVRSTLNAGVFALRRDAPHWAAWRRRQAQVIKRARLFSSDQLSLGMAIYLDKLPVALMPETCNYFGPWRCRVDSGGGERDRRVSPAVRPSRYCSHGRRQGHEDRSRRDSGHRDYGRRLRPAVAAASGLGHQIGRPAHLTA